ncbi:hypothetical protein QOZ80_3BG0293280 [Eleusine coracana subsp. coracana]|nr:hypothetical protein QOZ80_3BG0293280 [Eleusine coracana subsp. coracana]
MAAAAMARAMLVAVVLMQCCNVIVAARPLLEATAAVEGGDGCWLERLMQVLSKGGSGPGTNPGGWNGGH